jgi:hypothetical protein
MTHALSIKELDSSQELGMSRQLYTSTGSFDLMTAVNA